MTSEDQAAVATSTNQRRTLIAFNFLDTSFHYQVKKKMSGMIECFSRTLKSQSALLHELLRYGFYLSSFS